ncbi:DNA polymerase III subunit delta [Hydrogenimonas thermophila]|uniref:DNA polymerase III subunit delta n=1 Tax=Hydrogenimonas thermophila TaxID=223786 RepID=UPI002936FDF3|nr:DNA polymerase III subunit delta [Hydrogenimonas thermophila]WOE70937.1 DNA polymerase III subunit delta [Hydrogenimonas thermophila]WOE73455.1 DNA polymerase III subunit delta [Hydrogenimonas thermophila]
MYKREFDQLLNSGTLPKSVMLYGENEYYIESSIKKIIEISGAGDSILKLYYDEYDFQKAKNWLSQSSLFGDVNFLLVKSDKKIPKKELTQLIELAFRNETNYFVYAYTGSEFKTLTSAFAKKMNAEHVRFFQPSLNEAVSIIKEHAQNLNIQIDRYAIEHLLMALNINLSMALNELEKLSILNSPISSKEIDEHIFSLAPMAVNEFLFSLFSKKPLTDIINQISKLGEDEFALLRQIQYFTNQLFLYHIYIKLHGTPNAKEILGYSPPKHVVERYAKLAIKTPMDVFEKVFDTLAEGEIAIKTAGNSSQKETLLFSILIKIKSFLG